MTDGEVDGATSSTLRMIEGRRKGREPVSVLRMRSSAFIDECTKVAHETLEHDGWHSR